ncbi:cysteine--tRNA ligase [Caviibacter abscessus]|uniref:cysteine--tRNA ligase n=1 Tax=Caviibacter abscessus TaxID=1766719 RepID=UPI0008320A15|nr:cysteine--tRNA ligase [Caviibacter abscessus]
MKLYNTLTNKIEEFNSINKNEVLMYVCGPTVYNYIHIGNTRPLVVFDVLARYLKSLGYNVRYVQNFTDIDDKIIKRSNEENESCDFITEKYIKAFMEDTSKLNLLKDIIRPKVTDNIDEIIIMINKLIEYGYAYEKNGDIIFSVDKFSSYGKLSKQKLENLNAGNRVEINKDKNNPFDFVLWKRKKENEPYYNSPFSEGRPGWHIECSALIKKYLGDNIDIHAGGQDLIFPHHENEIAQSICSNKEKTTFVNYWLHNGYVTLNNEKMSKSTGNFLLLRDVLKNFSGNVIRYFILSSHYRKNLNFNETDLQVAKKTLEKISKTLYKYSKTSEFNKNETIEIIVNEFKNDFKEALDDDMNTPKAFAAISKCLKKVNSFISSNLDCNLISVYDAVRYHLVDILGIELIIEDKAVNSMESELLQILINLRNEARNNKNYELADKIRDELLKLNISISDKK